MSIRTIVAVLPFSVLKDAQPLAMDVSTQGHINLSGTKKVHPLSQTTAMSLQFPTFTILGRSSRSCTI